MEGVSLSLSSGFPLSGATAKLRLEIGVNTENCRQRFASAFGMRFETFLNSGAAPLDSARPAKPLSPDER
jgi:hypothetical protein